MKRILVITLILLANPVTSAVEDADACRLRLMSSVERVLSSGEKMRLTRIYLRGETPLAQLSLESGRRGGRILLRVEDGLSDEQIPLFTAIIAADFSAMSLLKFRMNSQDDRSKSIPLANADAPRKNLSPAAQRALAEAEARRAEIDRKSAERAKESGGPKGLEPTRYGDWEHKGLASDF